MLDRSDIRPVHWQMKRTDNEAVLGEIAAELDDLVQEIRQCILTPPRSVPLNPEKGCDLEQFKDRPLDVRQLFVVAEVRSALDRDVPRINVQAVVAETTFTSISIVVTWSPLESIADEFIETRIDNVL